MRTVWGEKEGLSDADQTDDVLQHIADPSDEVDAGNALAPGLEY